MVWTLVGCIGCFSIKSIITFIVDSFISHLWLVLSWIFREVVPSWGSFWALLEEGDETSISKLVPLCEVVNILLASWSFLCLLYAHLVDSSQVKHNQSSSLSPRGEEVRPTRMGSLWYIYEHHLDLPEWWWTRCS
jgi:hypothetical protein